MLNFMNSKLTKMTGKGKQNHIFQKSKSYEISSTVIYISKDQKFIIHVFYWCIPLDHEIYTKCNKKHLTWLKLYLVIISALELKVNKQKKHLTLTAPKPFDFSQYSSVPFHRVTFEHPISWVLLIDKPNQGCKNSKKFGRNALSFTKKEKQKILHQQRQMPQFHRLLQND